MRHLPTANHGKKFFATRQFFKNPRVGTGHGHGTLLLNPAHLHAEVARLDDDDDTLCVEGSLQALAYLGREPFLQLQAAGKGIDKAGQLAETGHATVGHIADVDFPEEREYVMFAKRVKLDVFDNDHLSAGAVFFFEDGRFDDGFGRLLVARCEREHGFGCTQGRLYEALAGGVFAQNFEYGFVMGGQQLHALVVRKILYTVGHVLFFI